MKIFTSIKISLIMLVILSLLSVLVYSVITREQIVPIDHFYALIGGNIDNTNITFEWNASPTDSKATIINGTLWHNITGTWAANATNATTATLGASVRRQLKADNDTNIFSYNLADGLNFIWGIEVCDNKTIFVGESVNINKNAFGIIFDNKTGCTGSCNYTVVVQAGSGFVSNFPVSTLDDVSNSTTGDSVVASCKLNNTETGLFYCNQTRTTWNGSTDSIETLIESNVLADYTIASSCRFTANRTVFVEDAPVITLNSPATDTFSDAQTVTLNVTVTGDDTLYGCLVYTNDTGTWVQDGGSFNPTNNTVSSFNKVFSEGNGILWGVRCHENSNGNIIGWSANNTLNVDLTAPVISQGPPADGTYKTTRIFFFNATANDANIDSCNLYINTSNNNQWNNWSANTYNESKSDVANGVQFNFTRKNFSSDGTVKWRVGCNDSAGNIKFEDNITVIIDTTSPTRNRIANYSQLGNCKGFTFEINSSEEVNLTFTYGLTSKAQSYLETEVDFEINQTTTLTFNNTYETDFFANATICDRAGNCNDNSPEMIMTSPVSLCTGWNIWNVYDNSITFSDIFNDTTADFVYWWNNTNQAWLSFSSASTSRRTTSLGIGNSVHLFTSVNNTWFRNHSGTPQYDINITSGHNYLPIYYNVTMGNLSYMQFMNSSQGNTTDGQSIYGAGGVKFQIDFFNVFNNTKQEWHTSIFTWLRNNKSQVGSPYKIGLDTLHVYSLANITANMTYNGQTFANWSLNWS